MNNNVLSAHRRFLPRLTTDEIRLIDKRRSLLVLPTGSVEQHGPHLPVFTDSLINEKLVVGALDLLPEEADVWALPQLSYGKSNEHSGFSGVFTLSTAAYYAVLTDIIRSAATDGWRRLLIVNSHGGNPEVIALAARDAKIDLNMDVFMINTGGLYRHEDFPARENEFGIHGGALETSLMLHIRPEWVRKEKYAAKYPAKAENSLFQLAGDLIFAWKTSELSASGAIGDPALSGEKAGGDIYGRVTKRIAEAMLEALAWETKG